MVTTLHQDEVFDQKLDVPGEFIAVLGRVQRALIAEKQFRKIEALFVESENSNTISPV